MSASPILITPSILSADFGHLQDEVDSVASCADWLQIDVMDGHFVPQISFGLPVVKCIKTSLPLDIHLMVENPEEQIAAFASVRPYSMTFHAEAVPKTVAQRSLIRAIRATGAKAGIAVNPETPIDSVGDVLSEVDLLLIMSVHPGFPGQEFIEHVLGGVKSVRAAFPDLMIQMDGGIDDTTAPLCIAAGANNLVSGSFIFGSKDRRLAVDSLRKL